MAILATYRLAQLVSKDDGPLDVFKRLRLHARKRAGYHQGIMNSDDLPEIERLVSARLFAVWRGLVGWLDCPYCNGVWFAALCIALLLPPLRAAGWWLVAWLAIAGGQVFLQDVNR